MRKDQVLPFQITLCIVIAKDMIVDGWTGKQSAQPVKFEGKGRLG